LEGKPSAFDRVSLELLALLSPGPEWSTGYPELESDRTPLARVNLACLTSHHIAQLGDYMKAISPCAMFLSLSISNEHSHT